MTDEKKSYKKAIDLSQIGYNFTEKDCIATSSVQKLREEIKRAQKEIYNYSTISSLRQTMEQVEGFRKTALEIASVQEQFREDNLTRVYP